MRNRTEFIRDKLFELHTQTPMETLKTIQKEKINPSAVINKKALSDTTEDMLFEDLSSDELLLVVKDLEDIYNSAENRYKKIQAAMFLSRIFSYYLPNQMEMLTIGTIPYAAIKALEHQSYDEALKVLNDTVHNSNYLSEAMMKVLGLSYWSKAFSIIEEQVKACFSSRYPGLFKLNSIDEYHLKNPSYYNNNLEIVSMPVRIEHTSCIGSDIFYLAMDRPEKARCINISVDLFDADTEKLVPPINVIVRPIKEKGIRLTSVDLNCSKMIVDLDDLFNMYSDDLSLLKAAIIVSGVIPPAVKSKECKISLLELIGEFMSNNPEFEGFEIISKVIDIPRGSGLAVSTNLLASLILALMRFSGQTTYKNDYITDEEKLEVAMRCIYGEWLGGSGGGWQDYGGMWGGFKTIKGQYAHPIYDQDSVGSLLPKYEEMDIPEYIIDRIMSSMVLVNGGTGQDVGPVLRMITEQYILRDKAAWNARIRTENRFDKIMEALISGDIEMLGHLEQEDFEDRKIISPLSNNLYHQKTYERMKCIFGDDLWGYDSTGGRAGAGGIFFVNPTRKKEFEEVFLTESKYIQESLAGQMHFSSIPRVYRFQVNKSGANIIKLKSEDTEDLINQYFKGSEEKCFKSYDKTDSIETIKGKCSFDAELFEKLQKAYKDGNLSIKNNIKAGKDEIKVLIPNHQDTNVYTLPEIGSREYDELFNAGLKLLKEPIAYMILNGGESTRFGVHTIRGLNPAFYLNGGYSSLIELKMRHLSFLHNNYDCPVYPVFVNSFFTNEHTEKVLKTNNYFGVPETNVYTCIHQVSHRVNPKECDLDYWHEFLREKGITENEEDLSKQYIESMKEWARKEGEGNIYKPAGINKLYSLVSPGHFYSFMSIVTSYTLGNLLEKGVKRLLVSSNDNLLATIDPAILAYHTRKGFGTTAEVVPRLFDKGGAPVMIGNKVVILEDFSFPDQETLWKVPFFNPITTWIEIDSLLNLLGLDSEDLIEAAHGNTEKQKRCNKAVTDLGEKLNTYVVLKHISEDMGDGITYEFPVIQFEKLYGDLIEMLNPMFLLVPKVLRHTQMKSVDHIYQITVDKALEVLKPQICLDI